MNKPYYAPVAHMDRVTDSDSVGSAFESHQAHHFLFTFYGGNNEISFSGC